MMRWRPALLIAANTALLIVLVQWGVHGALLTYYALAPRLLTAQPPEYAYSALPQLSADEVRDLWRDTAWLPFRFAGGAGFVHGQEHSRFVNVDAYGIRSNGSAPRSVDALDDGTWLFGGSTSFGFGVPDHQTIAAYLEQRLGAPVLNLAVRGHGSTMENRLFRYYLRAGHRPKRVVFLDGINEVCEPDLFNPQMQRLMQRAQDGYRWEFGEPVLFAAKLLREWVTKTRRDENEEGPEVSLSCQGFGRDTPLGEIVGRALAERQAICALDAITCYTFVQPFGGVHGPQDDRRFASSREGLEMQNLYSHLAPVWTAHGAIFITHAFEGEASGMWVDPTHYSPRGNKLVAEMIYRRLQDTAP